MPRTHAAALCAKGRARSPAVTAKSSMSKGPCRCLASPHAAYALFTPSVAPNLLARAVSSCRSSAPRRRIHASLLPMCCARTASSCMCAKCPVTTHNRLRGQHSRTSYDAACEARTWHAGASSRAQRRTTSPSVRSSRGRPCISCRTRSQKSGRRWTSSRSCGTCARPGAATRVPVALAAPSSPACVLNSVVVQHLLPLDRRKVARCVRELALHQCIANSGSDVSERKGSPERGCHGPPRSPNGSRHCAKR